MGKFPDYNADGRVDMEDVGLAPADRRQEVFNLVHGTVGADKITELEQLESNIQTSPLPSIPSISNVGSVPFTGTVSSIPGGFQPLPQVVGSKKKLYQLSQFHGGINQRSSPRDISDQECQEAINVTFSQVGRIKLLGDCLNEDNSLKEFAGITVANLPGYGLFEFVAPADPTGAVTGEQVILLTADGDQVQALCDKDNDGGDDTTAAFIDFAGSGDSDTDIAQIYYAAGNGVYVADANFTNTANSNKAKIYVYREDQNETVSGWVSGNPLINSPTTDNEDATPAGEVGIQETDIAASLHGALEVCIVPTGAGNWDGEYFFYASWLFDGRCETGLTGIGTETFDEQTLRFNPSLCHTNAAPLGGDKRIEGARIYFKESGAAERYLLAELSLVDGVKGALDSTFIPWTISANVGDDADEDVHDLVDTSRIVFDSPPNVYSYASLNGYYANEVYTKSPDLDQDDDTGGTQTAGPTPHDVRYKTAVVGSGGIVFIGNVKFDSKHMPDLMMFSMPGKPGVFPQYNSFDSPSSDGSPITALAAFQDTILQFKQNGMYVIDVSNPAEFYTQASYRDCGVFNPCQVFTTSFGVIFANKNGCYIYDGTRVTSLTDGKFDWITQSGIEENTSNTSTSKVPCVGYDPRSKSIIVLKNIGDDADSPDEDNGWVYNMITQSWTEGSAMIHNENNKRHTNFIITSEGYLSIKANTDPDGSNTGTTLLNYNHDKATDDGDQTITYVTKDLDFGLPSQTKKIFKVYVTYYSDDSTVPALTYGTDGAAPTTAVTGTFATSNGLQTTAFTVGSVTWTGIKSLSLKIAGATDHSFEINDISILYRARPFK